MLDFLKEVKKIDKDIQVQIVSNERRARIVRTNT
ncbi:hypothetical protein HNQ35_001399 [Cerasibacillus quisquiliarum]|nr:hypothetical protein [Cerasibacillus quisquiliarum]